MMKSTDGIKAGNVLTYWHDDGRGGCICFARVEKVTPKRLRVTDEQGRRGIKRPEFFREKLSEKRVAALRADGVSI
jgi:hypothetical protein